MDREDFISSLSNGVVVLGGCGTVGSLIARILASHNIDVTIKDSVSETFLEPIFKNEGVHLCLSHQLDNNSFNNISAIFIAPSLLNNKIFMGKVNNFNTNNLPIYSIDEILTYFTPDKPVIGVTGTNGKSTTTHSLKHIFSVNGYKVPSHGLPIQGNNEYTPSLQSRLSGDIGILEIGTFGIAGEIYTSASNSHVNMGVITNITHDHLNNGSYEDYINCKKEMIQVADELVLDGDDPTLLNILETDNKKIYYFGIKDMDNPLFKDSKYNMTCPKCGCKLKYDIHYLRSLGEFNCECGFTNPPLNVYADNIQIIKENNITKTSYTIHFEDQESATINLPNSGIHNVYNSLAAACAAWKSGLDIDQIIKGIESFNGVPGRLEYIHNDPTIIIDFAHNPAGVETIIRTVLQLKTDNNKIIVLNTISSESGREGDMVIADVLSSADIVIPVSSSSVEISKYIQTKVVNFENQSNFNKTGTLGSSPEQVEEGLKLALELSNSNDIILVLGEAGVKYSKNALNKILQ